MLNGKACFSIRFKLEISSVDQKRRGESNNGARRQLELEIMCKWNRNSRSDRLQRKKRSSNLRAPFAFQPSEMQILA